MFQQNYCLDVFICFKSNNDIEDDTLAVLDSTVDGISGKDRWERHFSPVGGTTMVNYSQMQPGTVANRLTWHWWRSKGSQEEKALKCAFIQKVLMKVSQNAKAISSISSNASYLMSKISSLMWLAVTQRKEVSTFALATNSPLARSEMRQAESVCQTNDEQK